MADRKQIFDLLGINAIVPPLIQKAYDDRERKEWENNSVAAPHGYAWHTKFHASSFPGSPESCGRKAVYGLLGLPDAQPMTRQLRAYAEAGQDAETRIVNAFDEYGILLSASTTDKYQTNFKDEEAWLSGNTDCVILPYRWTKPHVVEIKSRSLEKVLAMKAGDLECDPQHENQCRSYIHMAHDKHPWANKTYAIRNEDWTIIWPEGDSIFVSPKGGSTFIQLEPCTTGSVLYVARDNPSVMHEFYFEYDEQWYQAGKSKLLGYKEDFLEDRIPDRPTHEDGKVVGWSEEPCKWCPLKKFVCKPDYKEGINKLSESNAITFAKSVQKEYSYDEKVKEVIETWN